MADPFSGGNTGFLPPPLVSAGGMAIAGSIASATEGSVLFAGVSGVLQQNNALFFWDDTNNALGVGTGAAAVLSATVKLALYPDIDTSSILGRVSLNSTNSDFAQFAHFDQRASAINFGLGCTTAGATIVNVAAGQNLSLSSGGSGRWVMVGTSPFNLTAQTDLTCLAAGLGAALLPGLTFRGDLDTGFYSPGANQVGITCAGAAVLLAGSATLGFFGTAAVARPTAVAVTAVGIHAALVTLGLITA